MRLGAFESDDLLLDSGTLTHKSLQSVSMAPKRLCKYAQRVSVSNQKVAVSALPQFPSPHQVRHDLVVLLQRGSVSHQSRVYVAARSAERTSKADSLNDCVSDCFQGRKLF
jgi:hypothetical protein